MRRQVITHADAFCLHIKKYKETSAILDCFTKEHGRLDVVGKGLYRPKSRNALPEYFQEYKLSSINKTDLGTLTELELVRLEEKVLGQAWLVACYANELLIKFIPRFEPLPELYMAYISLLDDLRHDTNHQISLLWFEKRLLDSLGYGINFLYDSDNGEFIEVEQFYEYKVNRGFKISHAQAKFVLPGYVVLALAHETWNESYNEYFDLAKRTVRIALKNQLGENTLSTVAVVNDLNHFIKK